MSLNSKCFSISNDFNVLYKNHDKIHLWCYFIVDLVWILKGGLFKNLFDSIKLIKNIYGFLPFHFSIALANLKVTE